MSASLHRREAQSDMIPAGVTRPGMTRRDLLAATALGLVAGAPGIARAAGPQGPKGDIGATGAVGPADP